MIEPDPDRVMAGRLAADLWTSEADFWNGHNSFLGCTPEEAWERGDKERVLQYLEALATGAYL